MKKTRSKQAKKLRAHSQLQQSSQPQKITFMAHLQELRKRLFFVAIFILAGASVAYNFHEPITAALLRPADGQQFIYTAPGGGLDFLFRICLYSGLLVGIPALVYQLLRYLQPLIRRDAMRVVTVAGIASVLLAIVGVIFGYTVGLPAAMHFLLQGFSSEQIKALITIQSYMSFVMMYLLASALLFQVPLIMLVINRIKPLKPKKLFAMQRWAVLASLVISAVISPTPDIQNLLMLSVPMIITYQLGIVFVWLANRRQHKPRRVIELLRQDAETQATRLAQFNQARSSWEQVLRTKPAVAPASAAQLPKSDQIVLRPIVTRERRYANYTDRMRPAPQTAQVNRQPLDGTSISVIQST